MPLIKVKEKGQMTIPAEIRSTLKLSEGDVLEAEVEDGRIVLTPKVVMDRREAFFAFLEAQAERTAERLEKEGMSQDDLEELIVKEVRAARRERNTNE